MLLRAYVLQREAFNSFPVAAEKLGRSVADGSDPELSILSQLQQRERAKTKISVKVLDAFNSFPVAARAPRRASLTS